ncbi:hypothetical protein HALLA_14435 [Halostagnicola larsenii XH-48]|uniref:Uncharacterized protein n=1 Tax=Halostagnicola larsenii XH-48 TaxID=797299 RepID=W0JS71_9EURY|nr:hypothetical protein [Halostagnicola larsenii]AHF99807.1 hypothetical protein HALLA_14435 [Halostagnicola larsenii XH-48]
MDKRSRLIVGTIWIAVACIMATTLEPSVPTTVVELLRVFVVLMALFLGFIYLFDPRGLITERRFH